jgi:hypothetical protein
MTHFRTRLHQLINQLSDDELNSLWLVLADFYNDAYMLRAIQSAKRCLTPGDTFTREEALRVLSQL